MIYKIDVTEEDISSGNPGASDRCPLARAIRRQTPFVKTTVGTNCWYKLGANVYGIGEYLPAEATKFRFDFDHHKKVEPFSFELEVSEDASA